MLYLSFRISLQNNISPPNYLVKDITDIAYATGTLRNGTSITNPTVIIESELSEQFISQINYMYIETFNRYYYVNEIISMGTQLWRVAAHIDVLMSFKTQILANSGIISKQYEKWNLYIDDGTFRSEQDCLTQVKTFPSGFDTYEWVLAVAGNQAQSPT